MKKILLSILAAASSSFAADVNLQWDDNNPSEQVVKYTVYELVDAAQIQVTDTLVASAKLVDIAPGLHTYVVTATNIWGESDLSYPVSTPSPTTKPSNVKIITIAVTVE